MDNRETVAAILAAALLKPTDYAKNPVNAGAAAAVHAVAVYMQVLGALTAKMPEAT